jgi:hypothetical protein
MQVDRAVSAVHAALLDQARLPPASPQHPCWLWPPRIHAQPATFDCCGPAAQALLPFRPCPALPRPLGAALPCPAPHVVLRCSGAQGSACLPACAGPLLTGRQRPAPQVLPALEVAAFLLGELRAAAMPLGGGADALGLQVRLGLGADPAPCACWAGGDPRPAPAGLGADPAPSACWAGG